MTTITFGKYSGKTALQVAMIDPDYAVWAARNLKAATWRKAFTDALAATASVSAETVADARFNADHDENASHSAYLVEAKEEKIEQGIMGKKNAIVKRWANEIGKPVATINAIIARFWDCWEDVSATQFSSPAMHQIFLRYMAEIETIY